MYDQNFYGGEGVVDGEGVAVKGVAVKDGSWGSLRDLSKNILKQWVGKGKSCSWGEGVLKVSPPLPPRKILIIHLIRTTIPISKDNHQY